MSDISSPQGRPTSPKMGSTASSGSTGSTSVTDQASAMAKGLKDQAGETAQQIKSQASNLLDSAKDMAGDAKDKIADKIGETLNEQKGAGADYVKNVAGAVRRAAEGFEKDIPQAAQYIRMAAEQIDGVSSALRNQNFGQLVGGVQDFARRQPTAFLGAAVVAGFALVRFLKSSGGGASHAGQSQSPSYGQGGGGASMNRGGQRQDFASTSTSQRDYRSPTQSPMNQGSGDRYGR
jgi:gas vesicle protein